VSSTTPNISSSAASGGNWHPAGVSEKRPTNSELKLQQLEEKEEREAAEEKGILELFDAADEPLQRDADRQPDQ
jgi:hypothetical protein